MKKNLIKVTIILSMLLMTLIPLSVNAEIIDSGTCGDNLTYSLNDDGVLVINGTGPMTEWSSIADVPWNGHRGSVQKIIFPNGITSIGNFAFQNCGIKSVTIPDSVTIIGKYAFSSNYLLTSVSIGNSVKTIDTCAFHYCRNLASVTMGNSVEIIGDKAFYSCDKLTSIIIPDSVKTIDMCAFECCTGLTSVHIGNSVENIGDKAFRLCNALTSVIIPDSVKTIGTEAFYTCDSLTSVIIGNFVKTIGDKAFSNCTALTSVYIGNSVETIDDEAFFNCNSLASVNIPNSVTTIGYNAFYNCTSLKTTYYNGTKSQWNNIMIDIRGNDYLKNSVIFVIYTKTNVSGNTFTTTPVNIENGKTVILALFDGDKFVEMQSVTYEGEAITFTTDKTYTTAKVMVWKSLETCMPLCKAENVPLH